MDLAGWLRLKPSDKNARPLSDYLRSAKLGVAELDYLGFAFRDVSLDLAVTAGSLRITVGGPNVAGTIIVPLAADSIEPWNLQFERLHFDVAPDPEPPPDAAARAATEAATGRGAGRAGGPADPRSIPAVNFHAANLEWGERQVGDVRATLVKLDDGIGLTQLTIAGGSYNVERDRRLARQGRGC